jgi:hypothetical protein
VHYAAIAAIDGQVRYLVLEESWSPVRADATVLGEWTSDGHVNLGPGPVPDQRAFVQAVRTLLAHDEASGSQP